MTKKYQYSYDFSAMLRIGSLENLKAVAILHFSQTSKTAHIVNSVPRDQKLNMQHFFDKQEAINWLKDNLSQAD